MKTSRQVSSRQVDTVDHNSVMLSEAKHLARRKAFGAKNAPQNDNL